jgi:hypothetical protein
MASWFKRKAATKNITIQKVGLKAIDYPPKIILAWAKAIEGNDDLMRWLKENGYSELVMATFAIYLKKEARDWLVTNGYAHLMAMINASEGSERAQKWLQKHNFNLLFHMAMAVEDDQESWGWLGKNTSADIFLLTQAIKKVKDKIEEHHNDVHSFGKDL